MGDSCKRIIFLLRIDDGYMGEFDMIKMIGSQIKRFVSKASPAIRAPEVVIFSGKSLEQPVTEESHDMNKSQNASTNIDTNDQASDSEYHNKQTGEIGGPRGKEPTRFGDWERKGRVSDF